VLSPGRKDRCGLSGRQYGQVCGLGKSDRGMRQFSCGYTFWQGLSAGQDLIGQLSGIEAGRRLQDSGSVQHHLYVTYFIDTFTFRESNIKSFNLHSVAQITKTGKTANSMRRNVSTRDGLHSKAPENAQPQAAPPRLSLRLMSVCCV
jgi:hypothetical protein